MKKTFKIPSLACQAIFNFVFQIFQATRLGKHINELRRKASDKQLASRAKSLVKKWRELLMPTSGSGTATPVQQQNSSKDQVSQAQQVQVAPPVQVVQPNNMAAAMAQRLTNGHGPHHNNHLRGGTPMGGQVSSQPSSRLTSPAVSSSSRLSPGLSTPTGLGGGHNNVPTARVMPISSSSMPSRYYFRITFLQQYHLYQWLVNF